ncbi:MAG TPA: hypothetical protein VFH51_04650 [Myxococcota bacterium]|nr:hypothetical protein [Myxococcota bacterium]
MPFSSLTGAGFEPHGGLIPRHRHHPYPVRTMVECAPPAPRPVETPPCLPGAKPAPEPDMLFGDYFTPPTAPPEVGPALADVRFKDGVWMHPAWTRTSLAAALRPPACRTHVQPPGAGRASAPALLDLNAVTPEMITAMPPVTRRCLMDVLGGVDSIQVTWRDPSQAGRKRKILHIPAGHYGRRGRRYERPTFLGIPYRKEFRVNGATGLALAMAASGNHDAYVETMTAGLPHIAENLNGKAGAELFGPCDTARILARTLADLPRAMPRDFRVRADAASSLLQHFFEQHCTDSPDTIRTAFEAMLHELGCRLPRDADHLGLCIGVILVGVAKYTGNLSLHDNHHRWRVASGVNLVWAASSFAPIFTIAGPIALGVVAGGVMWDRMHPVRDYGEMLCHFEAELMQLLLAARLPWLDDEKLARVFLRLRQAFKAAGLDD